MTKEKSFFIQLITDHLTKSPTEPCGDMGWNEIFELAKLHQVEGIVFYQCKTFIPEEIRGLFESAYYSTLYNYSARQYALKQILSSLEEKGIPCFLIKGLEVSLYYPRPALRTMGDLDVVVHREDRPEVNKILLACGFKNISHLYDREWQYYKDSLEYELHDRLVYHEVVTQDEHEAFFNECWKYVHNGKLDASFHFLFLILHLRKHLMNEGVGFRQFMDIALMAKNEAGLDWEWILAKLAELKLDTFSTICFGFIKRWFGIAAPIEAVMPNEEFYELGTESIFLNGIFGFDNEDNRKNAAVNAARRGKWRKLSMLNQVREYMFPSYEYLINHEKYSYLIGKPYLLPITWIHRFIRNRTRIESAEKKVSMSFASDKDISRRDAYLKNWGL